MTECLEQCTFLYTKQWGDKRSPILPVLSLLSCLVGIGEENDSVKIQVTVEETKGTKACPLGLRRSSGRSRRAWEEEIWGMI